MVEMVEVQFQFRSFWPSFLWSVSTPHSSSVDTGERYFSHIFMGGDEGDDVREKG